MRVDTDADTDAHTHTDAGRDPAIANGNRYRHAHGQPDTHGHRARGDPSGEHRHPGAFAEAGASHRGDHDARARLRAARRPWPAHCPTIACMGVVDAHVHLFAPGQVARRTALAASDPTFAELYADPNAKVAVAGELIPALDRAGIDRAVAAGFAFAHPAEVEEQNRALAAAAAASGGRIIPLATLNLAHHGWRAAAETALVLGARGFGELRPHNQGWDPLGRASHELCELAAAAGVPLLWHVSESVGHRYPGKAGGITPWELCELASAHRATAMIAAHLGGGLPFYLQMPELRAAIGNVYFDTAAVSLLYDEGTVARVVDLAGPGRVLFASDFPLLSPLRQLTRIRAGLPAGAAQAVCGGNADSLFPVAAPPRQALDTRDR